MTDEQAKAYQEAEEAARQGVAELLERVADKIGMHAGARAVFGEPVERDGVTVIPVAQVIIGTGAGSGTSADDEGGSGAGGGAISRPLGYIEIGGGTARYVPLQPSWLNPGALVATVIVALIVSRTLVRIAGR
jgi:uncharacterized spore protein YtfJ